MEQAAAGRQQPLSTKTQPHLMTHLWETGEYMDQTMLRCEVTAASEILPVRLT
jgi:hypothetical protein